VNEDHPPVIAEEPAPQATPNPPRLRVPRETVPAGERAIEAAILSHVIAAGPDKSVTPTDVAMAMGADWRSKLTAVRRAAIHLAADGQIEILRKGKPVDPIGVKGVIRLRQAVPQTSSHPETAPFDELS
jgi:hypothetical protein